MLLLTATPHMGKDFPLVLPVAIAGAGRAGDVRCVPGVPRIAAPLIELADAGSEERAILESLSNHIAARNG